MEVRYRYRLRVSRQQAAALDQVFATNRFVLNQMVGRWNDLWRNEHEQFFERDMHRELTDRAGPGVGDDGGKPVVPAGIAAA